MGLIKCPECQSEISDKAENCPKCGYPIATNIQTAKQEDIKKEATPEQKAKRKKLIKRACICGGIVIILCVAIAVIYYFANRENISISKAQEYTANKQYDKVIEVLEPYKDSDGAKKLYDDAVFLTSDEGKFIIDFAQGLEKRWQLSDTNDNAESKDLVGVEWDILGKYDSINFNDEKFNEKAHAYLDALKLQKSAVDYIVTDFTKFSNLWDEGYRKRATLITYFLNNYPVPIDDKYADAKLEFQSAAQGIKAQQEFDSKIDMMIHKDNFVKTDTSANWKTYEITVTNETDKTFNYFGLYVNCLDADGKILSQEYTNQVNGYAPGQKATFEFMTDKNPDTFTWTADYYIE